MQRPNLDTCGAALRARRAFALRLSLAWRLSVSALAPRLKPRLKRSEATFRPLRQPCAKAGQGISMALVCFPCTHRDLLSMSATLSGGRTSKLSSTGKPSAQLWRMDRKVIMAAFNLLAALCRNRMSQSAPPGRCPMRWHSAQASQPEWPLSALHRVDGSLRILAGHYSARQSDVIKQDAEGEDQRVKINKCVLYHPKHSDLGTSYSTLDLL